MYVLHIQKLKKNHSDIYSVCSMLGMLKLNLINAKNDFLPSCAVCPNDKTKEKQDLGKFHDLHWCRSAVTTDKTPTILLACSYLFDDLYFYSTCYPSSPFQMYLIDYGHYFSKM